MHVKNKTIIIFKAITIAYNNINCNSIFYIYGESFFFNVTKYKFYLAAMQNSNTQRYNLYIIDVKTKN